MDKDYTKEELSKKRIDELKQILRNRQLKISGNKPELIERILVNQQSTNLTYFNILPKDVNKQLLLTFSPEEVLKQCENFGICDEKFYKDYEKYWSLPDYINRPKRNIRVFTTLFLLNEFGPIYGGDRGFESGYASNREIEYDPKNIEDPELGKLIQKYINNRIITNFNKTKFKYYQIKFPKEYIEKEVSTLIPYKRVTIYGSGGSIKPTEWYNEKGYWIGLPLLKTRKYIKIIRKFEEVLVDSDIKGSSLTIEDILFSTRALMHRGDRNIEGYRVVKEGKDDLFLSASIDNNST